MPAGPRLASSLFIAALAALVTLAAACGSTRFVVVDGRARTDATPTEETPPDTGATPTTAASAPTGEPSKAEAAAIRKAFNSALTVDDRPFAQRLEFLEGADDLEGTYRAVRDVVAGLDVEVRIDDIVLTGDGATVTTSVIVGGEPFATDVPVAMVRAGDTWKVTRAGACAVLALGSPCPDA